MSSPTLELAKQLINIPSITPNDNGCQKILTDRLKKIGFNVTDLSSKDTANFLAIRGETDKPLFVFSGHTDVVPPGNKHDWKSDPFSATIKDNKLIGRGAADMKTALASMIIATERFVEKNPNHKNNIGFMITSDEEGDATNGTSKIIEYMQKNNLKINWCLIGEASSKEKLGDGIKIGRRGSLHGTLTVFGKQGHIAYPHLAVNPIHRSFQALDFLTTIEWDKGNEHFSPTSFQIYNINADTGATNIIPGSLTARFNFRYSPASTAESLIEKTKKTFDDYQLHYNIDWNLSSKPFLSQPGKLTKACRDIIFEKCGIETDQNTTGGTSDGRFIAPTGAEVVELGLVNECIHQVDEYADIDDMEKLTDLYEGILHKLIR